MFKNIHFVKSVYDLDALPKPVYPQLILCGRSNVGKSSFINSIFNRKALAKTSSAPGKTRSINFYNVEDTFYLVDLPGFGYAKTSIKEREKWSRLISKYILESETIHHTFHLVDSRFKPTELDVQLNAWLKLAKLNYTLILNKVDKLKRSQINKTINSTLSSFPDLELNVDLFLYSSIEGKWRKPLQKKVTELFL